MSEDFPVIGHSPQNRVEVDQLSLRDNGDCLYAH